MTWQAGIAIAGSRRNSRLLDFPTSKSRVGGGVCRREDQLSNAVRKKVPKERRKIRSACARGSERVFAEGQEMVRG